MIDWSFVWTILVIVLLLWLVPLFLRLLLLGIAAGLVWLSEHTGTAEERRRAKLGRALRTYGDLISRRR